MNIHIRAYSPDLSQNSQFWIDPLLFQSQACMRKVVNGTPEGRDKGAFAPLVAAPPWVPGTIRQYKIIRGDRLRFKNTLHEELWVQTKSQSWTGHLNCFGWLWHWPKWFVVATCKQSCSTKCWYDTPTKMSRSALGWFCRLASLELQGTSLFSSRNLILQ